jgi:hypothetical protein
MTDILYTPLNTPPVPEYDLTALLDWCKQKSTATKNISRRLDSSEVAGIAEVYPWHIVYPRKNFKWMYDFDMEFPQLAEWFGTAYGPSIDSIHDIIMLPIKSEFTGTGFWHSDPDRWGMRVYLENQEPGEFLKIIPTKEFHTVRPNFGRGSVEPRFDVELQDRQISAKLLKPRQAFFLNNTTAVHAVVNPQPGPMRIAVIVSFTLSPGDTTLIELVERSAEKYQDYAIYWTE